MATLRNGARTDADAVRDIFETDLEDETLHAFINAASFKVDEAAAAAPSMDEDRLTEIETWFAAHLVTTRPELAGEEQMDSYSVTYVRESEYGEHAAMLDLSNILDGGDTPISFGTPDAKGTR